MREPVDIDKYTELMDRSPTELEQEGVPEHVRNRITRLRDIYAWWLTNPRKNDRDVVERAMSQYGLKRMQAYNDLYMIKVIMGNLQQVTKNFARFRFERMIEQAFEKAYLLNDARAMAAAAAAYGKYHMLDKEDAREGEYDLIAPQVFIPTSDPRSLGLKKIPNIGKVIKKLLKKYDDSGAGIVRLEAEDYNDKELLRELPIAEEIK